jgi:hypothetical protein
MLRRGENRKGELETKSAMSRPLNGNMRRKGIDCHRRNGRK